MSNDVFTVEEILKKLKVSELPKNLSKIGKLLQDYAKVKNSGTFEEYLVLSQINFQINSTRLVIKDPQESFIFAELSSQIESRMDSMLVDVPKKLIFVWLGKLSATQKNYIFIWLMNNPDYECELWYDSEAVLSLMLKESIYDFVHRTTIHDGDVSPETFEEILVSNWIKARIEAFSEIQKKMSEGVSFDDAVSDYLVSRLGKKEEDLNEIKNASLKSFQDFLNECKTRFPTKNVSLKDVKDVKNASFQDNYDFYVQELGLRQNLAAASDLLRFEALKEGGLYFDVDFLPEFAPGLFPEELSIKNKHLQDTLDLNKACAIVNHLVEKGVLDEMPGTRLDMDKKLRDAGFSDFADQIENSIKTHQGSFFKPLGDVKVPVDGLNLAFLNREEANVSTPVCNAGIVCPKKSLLRDSVIDVFKNNYDLLKKSNVIDEGIFVDREKQDACIEFLRKHISDYYKVETDYTTDVIFSFLSYMTEGIQGAKPTIRLTGPLGVKEGIIQSSFNEMNDDVFSLEEEKQDVLFSRDGCLSFFKTTTWTEEEAKSSWARFNFTDVKEGQPFYADSSNYLGQVILELDEGQPDQGVVEKAAEFLFKKRLDRSLWMRFKNDEVTKVSGLDISLNEKSRLIIVGMVDSDKKLFGGLTAEKLAETVSSKLPIADGIGRISLVGSGVDSLETETKFIQDFCDKLTVEVNEISFRKSLVEVDAFGHKWLGKLEDDGKTVHWTQNTEENKVVLVKNPGEKKFTAKTLPVEDGLVFKTDSINEGIMRSGPLNRGELSFRTQFAFGAELPSSFIGFEDEINILPEIAQLQDKKALFAVNDVIALLIIMLEGDQRVVICDKNPAALEFLRGIIQLASNSMDFSEWLLKLEYYHPNLSDFISNVLDKFGEVFNFDDFVSRITDDYLGFHSIDFFNQGTSGMILDNHLHFDGIYVGRVKGLTTGEESFFQENLAMLTTEKTKIFSV